MNLDAGVTARRLPSGAPGIDEASRTAFEAVLNLAPLACVAVDPDGIVVFWSASAETMFGWAREEVMGRTVALLSPNGELERKIREADGVGSTAVEITCRTHAGERMELNVWISPPGVAGNPAPVRLLFMVDVSEKKLLERALLETSEREQRRLGQDLHDHLAQHLLGAAFGVKALAGNLDREQSEHAPALHDLARLINDAVYQVRDISRGLHPVELDEAGLMSALQELAARVSHTVPCSFECEKPVLIEDSRTALHAYRIVQEVVTGDLLLNGADSIRISLADEGDFVRLQVIATGGKEGELTSQPSSLTVKTLLYRAQAMRATLTFDFQPATGTRVVCRFPNCNEY